MRPVPVDQSEYPHAYVVRRASEGGQKSEVDEVKGFMSERLAKSERLDGVVVFVDEVVSNVSCLTCMIV